MKIQAIVGLGLMLGGAVACSSAMPIEESTGQGTGALGAVGQAPKADGACRPRLTLCGGICRDLSSDEANCGACGMACDDSQTCTSGVCSNDAPVAALSPPPSPPPPPPCDGCGPRKTRCGTECVNLLSDEENCGACANACPAGAKCSAGVCM